MLTALSPRVAFGRGRPRVVVIGGGVGGVTVAKFLAANAATIDVILVEPRRVYTTCFFSNLYIAGLRPFDSLTHDYEALTKQFRVTVVHEAADKIYPAAKTVVLKNGVKLTYDRLVVAPGIAFRDHVLEGHGETQMDVMPHAWNSGPQSRLLRQQLENMGDGGLFVLVVPPDPIRCPPAPYERASLVAFYFQRSKPKSKILILDAKDSFPAQDMFQDAWNRHYPGMIEWLPAQFTGGVKAVDAMTRTVITAGETFKAAVANVIPAQMAGHLAQEAGLADSSGWCPVDPVTFESKLQPSIHLVGDAIIAGDMPKSATSAYSQAKACACAISADLAGTARATEPMFSKCYTYLGPDDAFSNTAIFKPDGAKLKNFENSGGNVEQSAEVRRDAARAAEAWYDAFFHDVFG